MTVVTDGPTQTADESASNQWAAHPRLAKAIRVAIVLTPFAITFLLTWMAGRHVPPERVGLNRWVWWAVLVAATVVVMRILNRGARRFAPLAALFQVSLIFPDEAPSRARAALRASNGRKMLREIQEAQAHGEAEGLPSGELLSAMLSALAAHEPLTRGHSERVRAYSDLIGEQLGLGQEDANKLRWASLLHDVGKLEVPAEILNSKGRPTDEEWEILKTHPVHGSRLINPFREWLGDWALAAEEHHLRWDGNGYPKDLAGNDISLAGRIVAVADAYDVMTSVRSYKKALAPEAARRELAACAGSQFDPMVVRAFMAVGIGELRAVIGPFGWLASLMETLRLPFAPTAVTAGAYGVATAAVSSVGLITGATDVPPAQPPATVAFVDVAVAVDDGTLSLDEDTVATVTVTGQGVGADRVVTLSGAEHGVVEAPDSAVADPDDPTGWFIDVTYSPDRHYNGPDAIDVVVCVAGDDCATGIVDITVRPINDPPETGHDTVVLNEWARVSIDVLANDTDPDGEELTLVSVTPPVAGASRIEAGMVVFEPDRVFEPSELLTYEVRDESGLTASGTVLIDLSDVVPNEPPVAEVDSASGNEDEVIVIDVLANDRDADDPGGTPGGPLTVSQPATGGTVTVTGNRTVLFTPDPDWNGLTDFSYSVEDLAGESATATVQVAVQSVNDPPSFDDGGDVLVAEGSGAYARLWAEAISPGPADEAGQQLVFAVTTDGPSLFEVQPTIDPVTGRLSFTPAGPAGSATITVTLIDNGGSAQGGQDRVTLTFTITVNAPPVAVEDVATTNEDSAATIAVLANDTDLEDGTPGGAVLLVSLPTRGTATVNGDGTITYNPFPDSSGDDAFTYVVTDAANATSDVAAVAVTVLSVNDAPSFVPGGNISIVEGAGATSFPGWASSISPGPLDESGQALTFTVSSDNAGLFAAAPSVGSDGTLAFTPSPGVTGSATVTVVLADDGGTARGGNDTAPAETFTITVNPVNDPPVAVGDVASTREDVAVTVDVLANDFDVEDGTPGGTTSVVAAPANGAAVANPDGSITYTPVAEWSGVDSFRYRVTDSNGAASGTVDVTVTVTPVNDEPSFTGGVAVTVLEDSGASTTVNWATAISRGPADESGQALTFVVINDNNPLFTVQPAINAAGTLTFTPAGDANGSAQVTVVLTDDGGTAGGGDDSSPPQTFTITVTAVNDEPSFVSGANVTVNEDSGASTTTNWATGISAGAANESGQVLSFGVLNDNNDLFAVQPAVSGTGTLTFTPAPHGNGSATVTVVLIDDGGTANGGDDASPAQSFTITVVAQPDDPVASGNGYSTPQDTMLTVGAPGLLSNDSDPDGDTITVNTTPVVDVANGTLVLAADGSFTYDPDPGYSGPDTFTYQIDDGTGRTDTAVVTLSVNAGGGSTLVVSQFAAAGAHYSGDFVELYNASGAALDISGWEVRLTDDASIMETVTIDPATVLPDGGYYLLALSGSGHDTGASADQLFTTPLPFNVGIGIHDGGGYTDQVGTRARPEAKPFSLAASLWSEGTGLSPFDVTATNVNQTNRRRTDYDGGHCTDTNNNSADFFRVTVGNSVRNTSTTPTPCGAPTPPAAAADSVVISEIRTDGPLSGRNEFIELFNSSSSPIDMTGWQLVDADSDIEFTFAVTLQPGQRYLIGGDDYTGPVDGTYLVDGVKNGGGITLLDPAIPLVIDEVHFDTSPPELPILSGRLDHSYARRVDGCTDTNNNRVDFEHVFVTTPQTSTAPFTPC